MYSLNRLVRTFYENESDADLKSLKRKIPKLKKADLKFLRSVLMHFDQQTTPSRVRIRASKDDIVLAEVNGITCALDRCDESVSQFALNSASYEEHLIAAFGELINKGDVVCDIGANVGIHTAFLANLVGESGRIVAFEPSSENAKFILLTANANRFQNIEIQVLALAQHQGYVSFSSAIGSNGQTATTINLDNMHFFDLVPAETLDNFFKGRKPPKFIKIDVEGNEYQVLKGGEKLLKESKPTIILEFSKEMLSRVSRIEPETFFAWLEELGYSPYLLRKDINTIEKIVDMREFLENWGPLSRIEDLMFKAI